MPSKFSTEDILAQAMAMENDKLIAETSFHNHYEFCLWLRNVCWQDLMEGKDISKLIALIAFLKPEEFPGLREGLLYLLNHVTRLLDLTLELILQDLNQANR